MRLQIQSCPKDWTENNLCAAFVWMKCALYAAPLVVKLSSKLVHRFVDAVFQELFAPAHRSNTTATSEEIRVLGDQICLLGAGRRFGKGSCVQPWPKRKR